MTWDDFVRGWARIGWPKVVRNTHSGQVYVICSDGEYRPIRKRQRPKN